jgi:uncharacterized LabA/DUF88 family protein
MAARRVRVYIDGFNLYYGALKANPALKWLDLQALGAALAPGADTWVRYFTAKVDDRKAASQARQRQYLAAVRGLPLVSVHFGHFTTHPTFMPLANPSPRGQVTAEVLKTEEKGSDVNLATFLLLDGFDRLYDEAIVISDDSDLSEPVAQANRRFGAVHVVSPRNLRLRSLADNAASWAALSPVILAACQLPSPLTLPTGRSVTRPPEWT